MISLRILLLGILSFALVASTRGTGLYYKGQAGYIGIITLQLAAYNYGIILAQAQFAELDDLEASAKAEESAEETPALLESLENDEASEGEMNVDLFDAASLLQDGFSSLKKLDEHHNKPKHEEDEEHEKHEKHENRHRNEHKNPTQKQHGNRPKKGKKK